MRMIKTQPNLSRRALATFIDFIIYFSIWIAYITYFGEPNGSGGQKVSGLKALPPMVFWFLYFPGMETIKGQTIGHMIMGLKVVTPLGYSISFGQAFKRRLMDLIDLFSFFGLVAIITIKNTDSNQRVGDIWAKTIVVGGESVRCQHCFESLTLSPDESISGSFECPICKTTNEN